MLSFKELLEEFIRHRVTVIRRRTQFLLAKARQRKHTVEGLLLAHANIDEVIRVIRTSATQAEAKERLMRHRDARGHDAAGAGRRRASPCSRRSAASSETYTLTPVQADAILRMTLGQLVNLEQEKLAGEHRKLLEEIAEYRRILSDEKNILDIIRDDCRELKRKHGDARRTEISGEEIGDDRPGGPDRRRDDGRLDQPATATSSGRRPRVYRAQRRGGKGLNGAKTEEEDPIQHLFVASTHAYLLFFTNKRQGLLAARSTTCRS